MNRPDPFRRPYVPGMAEAYLVRRNDIPAGVAWFRKFGATCAPGAEVVMQKMARVDLFRAALAAAGLHRST